MSVYSDYDGNDGCNDFILFVYPGLYNHVYPGSRCEANVNDCYPNPCSATGTDQCLDLVDSFQCVCNPGYTGIRCETDIDDCASQPCLHGGQCGDAINNFTCTCPPGWTGHTCDNKTELCDNSTCSNGARCFNLFDDFYCSCLPNTYGKACGNAPSICQNANPCLHGSTCSESQGQARCHCSPEFTGAGCEVQREYCSDEDPVCQHGATCSASLGDVTCGCPDGYTGSFCEVNINDCQFNSCPAGSTCIDMVDEFFCRCPVGRSGENCEKDTDRQFDLLFSNPFKTNMATLGYPLRLTGGGFSITMWVQYSTKGGMGTFFTLYNVRDANSLTGKQELIRLDEMGVTLSMDEQEVRLNTTVDYNKDGEWHYIVLSWDQSSGLLSFFVDTIRIPLQDYLKGQPLDFFVWMVLGCRYDVTTEACREGEGFNGYVSQVSLYSRELKFKDELTVLGNTDPFYVFPDAVMTWGEFLLHPGVTRTYPSKADQTCPQGYTGYPSCITPVAGKISVSVDHDSCPKDIIKYSSNRVTQISWPPINFKGQVNQVKSSLPSDDQCSTPRTPVNARQVFCANFTDVAGRGYRQCSVSCNPDHTVVVPSPHIHTCGPVGSWDPPHRYLPYTLPPCGGVSTPKRRLMVVIVYHVPSTECSELSQEVLEQMELRLQQQNSRWSNGLCQLSDCSDIQLDITCDRGTGPSGSQVPYSDITVTVTATDVPLTLTSVSDSSLNRSPEDLFQQLVLSDTVFDFSSRIAEAMPDPNGLDVQIELRCQAPMALSGDQCVDCAAGSYYDATSRTCSLCAIGTYQPLSGQTNCVGCTPGTTTETVGSFNSNQCKRVCATGQFYDNTVDDCALCPQGFYQNTTGLFYCYPCPVDKTTRQPGAKSQTVCFNDCPPGQELAENGTCTSCPIGFFKPSGETLCGPCPPGLVTNFTGAHSVDQCNVADNQPGYYRQQTDERLSAPCPIGTYQPAKWQYDCVSCGGERYRTDTMAATSLDQCRFFCPAGQEKDGDLELCRPCDIGYYRTGLSPYSACELCPNNTRTLTTGSKQVSDCDIYKCSPGYRPTADQESCEKCPRGFYQPLPDQTDCLRCMGAMMDTRTEGAMLLSECERYCDPGYQKLDNGTCIICPLGFYKDNTIDNFHECTRCQDTRYVTAGPGATSQTECIVLDCPAGHRIRGTVCEACPQGTYQDQPYQAECIPCPPLQSTRFNTSTSPSDCETYCDPGKEKKNTPERCDICQRGYYKNNLDNVFMDCTLCPAEYVTPTIGSTTQSECTVRNCTEGQYISGSECLLCEFGYYQPDRWQTSCLRCGKDRTTQRNGAVNQSECILSCPPGKENQPGSNVCTECQQGFYKNMEKASLCDPCPNGFVTRINGSTDVSDCELSACAAGSVASASSIGGCTSCPFGEYQPNKWQERCIPCPDGFTTFQRGATSPEQCLRDCLRGQEYINDTQSCEQCPVGYYNDDLDPSRFSCIMCNQDYITDGRGATSDRDCNIRNCTQPGQYRDPVDNVCRDCPRGQWQNQKWQISCNLCNIGLTTRYTGSTGPEDCLYDCPSGQYLVDGGQCTDCPVGSYRDKTDTWECQPCPDGLNTPNTGALSRDDCSIATCNEGYFFNNDAQVQRCQQCPQNSYQDVAGQFTCKPCPERTETRLPGATLAAACIDKCQTNSNNCDRNARCASTTDGVACVCNDGYVGDGNTCKHMCDEEDYCQNSVSCDRERFLCVCKPNYEGPTCQLRMDPKKQGLGDKDIIIVAVVTTLAFLLFLILLIVCCCVMARKRQRNKVPFPHETSDERASIATRMSTRGFEDFGGGYATKTPPFSASPRMMLPAQTQQMYENPTYTVSDGDPAVYKA